jgi:hypothetical protein
MKILEGVLSSIFHWKPKHFQRKTFAFIFRTEEKAKQETIMKRAASRELLVSGGDVFLRNVG